MGHGLGEALSIGQHQGCQIRRSTYGNGYCQSCRIYCSSMGYAAGKAVGSKNIYCKEYNQGRQPMYAGQIYANALSQNLYGTHLAKGISQAKDAAHPCKGIPGTFLRLYIIPGNDIGYQHDTHSRHGDNCSIQASNGRCCPAQDGYSKDSAQELFLEGHRPQLLQELACQHLSLGSVLQLRWIYLVQHIRNHKQCQKARYNSSNKPAAPGKFNPGYIGCHIGN